jgi:AhpC/TSA family
MKWTTD